MGIVSISAEAYAAMQRKLFPPGRAWTILAGSVIEKVLLASGEELSRISGRAVDLIREANSDTTVELAVDFESELGLVSTGTDEERQARITAKEVQQSNFQPSEIQVALAPYLEQESDDVVVIQVTRANAVAIGRDTEVYRFYVYRDPALPGTADIEDAQIELDKISHSHTRGRVIRTIAFKAGDICGGIIGA